MGGSEGSPMDCVMDFMFSMTSSLRHYLLTYSLLLLIIRDESGQRNTSPCASQYWTDSLVLQGFLYGDSM